MNFAGRKWGPTWGRSKVEDHFLFLDKRRESVFMSRKDPIESKICWCKRKRGGLQRINKEGWKFMPRRPWIQCSEFIHTDKKADGGHEHSYMHRYRPYMHRCGGVGGVCGSCPLLTSIFPLDKKMVLSWERDWGERKAGNCHRAEEWWSVPPASRPGAHLCLCSHELKVRHHDCAFLQQVRLCGCSRVGRGSDLAGGMFQPQWILVTIKLLYPSHANGHTTSTADGKDNTVKGK